MNRLLTMKDASRLIGVSGETLRRWEKNGLLGSIERDSGGHRLFTSEDVEQAKTLHHKHAAKLPWYRAELQGCETAGEEGGQDERG